MRRGRRGLAPPGPPEDGGATVVTPFSRARGVPDGPQLAVNSGRIRVGVIPGPDPLETTVRRVVR